MTTTKQYPSAPLTPPDDLEKRLKRNKNELSCFNNSVKNLKEMITYNEDKNHKLKKKYENYKNVNTIPKSVDSNVFIGKPHLLQVCLLLVLD